MSKTISKSAEIANRFYREGTAYNAVLAILIAETLNGHGITRAKLIEQAGKVELENGKHPTKHDVGVVLSPSENNMGNFSANGHLYYCNREPVAGSKRTLQYFYVERKTSLEPHSRPVSNEDIEAREARKHARAEAKAKREAEKAEKRAELEARKQARAEAKAAKEAVKEAIAAKAAERDELKAAIKATKADRWARKQTMFADKKALAAAEKEGDTDTAKSLKKTIGGHRLQLSNFDRKLVKLAGQLEAVQDELTAMRHSTDATDTETPAETSKNERPTEQAEGEAFETPEGEQDESENEVEV